MRTQGEAGQIDALTGIRALASCWVIACHLQPAVAVLLPAIAHSVALVADGGIYGVDLFFILSGFVLALNYHDRFGVITGPAYVRFLWLRLARVYPVHILVLFVFLLFHWASLLIGRPEPAENLFTLGTFVGNIFLVHWWRFPGHFSWNYPSWSISMEWLAYVCFPLVIHRVRRLRGTAATVCLAFGLLAATAYLSWRFERPAHLIRLGGEFVAGCLLHSVYRRLRQTGTWRGDRVTIPAVLAGITVANCFAWYSLPVFGLAVLALALDRGAASRFFGSAPMVYGGRISYSVYMVHAAAISACHVALPLAKYTGAALPVRVGVLAVYVAAIGISGAVVHHRFEEPARERMRQIRFF